MGIFDFLNKKALQKKLIDAAKNGNAALVCELLKKGTDVNAADKDGWTALMYALFYGLFYGTETAKLLIEKGADVNAVTKYGGWTALKYASERGNTKTALLLMEKRKLLTAGINRFF